MVLIICLLAAGAVFLLVYSFKAYEVDLGDEQKENRFIRSRVNKGANLIIGCLTAAVIAYAITGQLLFIVLSLPGGYFIANWLNDRPERARKAMLESQNTEVLNCLISSMQGGASPYQALEEAVPVLPSPARDIFIEIVRRARTGSNYEEAVETMAQKSRWNNLKTLSTVLRLYSKTGCDLVAVLKYLLKSAYEINTDRGYVRATTSSMRNTAKFLSGIPFLLMAMFRMFAPDFAAPLFTTFNGVMIIIIVTLMVLAGNLVVKKMVDNVI